MSKKIRLKPFKIKYDKQVKMWVAQDVNTGYASQGETREKAIENLIDALRMVILTYQDIKEPSEERETKRRGKLLHCLICCCSYWNVEQQKCLYQERGCFFDSNNQASMRKPKVSRAFVNRWVDSFFSYGLDKVQARKDAIQMFKELGLEMEE